MTSLLLSRRVKIGLLALASMLTVASTAIAPMLPFTADVAEYLPQEDDDVVFWVDLTRRFGALDILMIGLEEPGEPLQPDSLARLQRMTTRLAEAKGQGVLLARSLTNLEMIREDEEGGLNAEMLFTGIPSTPEEAEALRRRILSDSQAPGSFVSRDLRAYMILVRVHPDHDARAVARAVQGIVEEEKGSLETITFGAPFIENMITSRLYDKLVWVIPLFAALLFLPLFLLVRRWKSTGIVLVGAGISLLWWLALLNLFGVELTSTASGAALVLLVIAAAVYARLAEWMEISPTGNPLILVGMLGAAGLGFFVLRFASLPYLAHFGEVASVGILAIIGCGAFLVLPLLSSLAKLPPHEHFGETRLRPVVAVVLAVLLLAGGVAGASKMKFQISPRDIFSSDDDVGRSMTFFDRHFGGGDVLQISARGDFRQPGDCARLLRLTDLLEGKTLFSDVRSITQVLAMLGERFSGLPRVPGDPEALGNLWFFLEGNQDIRPLVLEDRSEAMIAARIAPGTQIHPAQWGAEAREAAEASAHTGRRGAELRLQALATRYGIDLSSSHLQQILDQAQSFDPARKGAIVQEILLVLKEYMASVDSPFEPLPEEWDTLARHLQAPSVDAAAFARDVAQMEGYRQMDYPPDVAAQVVSTLTTRRDSMLYDRMATAVLEELLASVSGSVHPTFGPRARGVLVDLLDPLAPATDKLEIRVSGFPAIIPQVEDVLLHGNWWASFIVWLVLALAGLAITRRPTAAFAMAMEALVAGVGTYALGWLFQVHLDAASAVLYLIPPAVSFFISPHLPVVAGDPRHGIINRYAPVVAFSLGLAGLSLLTTDVLPVIRIGAVMAMGLSLSAGIAAVSRRV